ncbi:hypothetical protein ACE6H2_001348 [Prunus campanulata]
MTRDHAIFMYVFFLFAGHVWLVKLCGREVFNSSTSRGFDVKKPVVALKDHQNL